MIRRFFDRRFFLPAYPFCYSGYMCFDYYNMCCASTMFDPTYICLEAVRHASVFVMFVMALAACIWQYISFSLQESSVSGTMMLTFTLFACPLLVNLENHYLAKRVEYVHWNEFWSALLKNTIWIARVGKKKNSKWLLVRN